MIQKETYLKCMDNTGVNFIKCVKLFGGLKKTATVGDSIIAVVKITQKRKKFKHIKKKELGLKKKNKVLALIVGVKKKIRRRDGSFFVSDRNRALLINKTYGVVGSRIYGFVTKELKYLRISSKYNNIITLAKRTL